MIPRLLKIKTPRSFTCWPSSPGRRLSTAVLLWLAAACSLPPTPARVPISPSLGSRPSQTGVASWYGPGFHGRPTASGEIYDQYKLTAAHQTLPLGSRVRVTNLQNGKSVEVAINDRGPFAKGRVIDLSYAAARVLEMVGPGTIPVRIEVIDSPARIVEIPSSLDYTLQIGSFAELENARRLKERLASLFSPETRLSIVPFQENGAIYYRVQVGTFSDHDEAELHARELAREGFPIVIMEK